MDKKVYALLLNKINSGGGGDTYTKEEIDEMISQLKQFETEYVLTLPLKGEPNVLYFVPRTSPSGNDSCYEYMWLNNKWEFVGSTEVDLSNYYTKAETEQYVSDHQYVLPEATTDTLGGVKLSSNGSVSMDADGNMVISTTSDDDIAALFGN